MKIYENKYNYLLKQIEPLLIFWFAGIFVFLFYIFNIFFNFETEQIEWIIYLLIFILSFIIFLIYTAFNFKINNIFKFLLSFPFYIYLFNIIEYSYVQIIFLLISLLLSFVLLRNKIDVVGFEYFQKSIFFYIIFNIFSKLLYWRELQNFFIYKFTAESKYINYADIINLITTPIILILFLLSFFLVINLDKDKYKFSLLFKYWWILPSLIFFFESFSTANFFENSEGTMIHHWQSFVGPIEMLNQGGLLLWDVPSQYGFLSILTLYLIPFNNPWLQVYFLNSILKIITSLIIFFVIWNKRGLYWYLLSFLLTFSIMFVLTITPAFLNSSITPASGPLRFFWSILLMYFLVKNKNLYLKKQILFILPVWLIGFFWSIESAFIVSALISPLILFCLIENKNDYFSTLKYIFIFPFLLIVITILVSIYYYYLIGNLPDYYSFIEYAVIYKEGFKAENINLFGSVIVFIFLLTLIFLKIFDQNYNFDKYIIYCIFCGLWALTSYCIGQGTDTDFLRILVFYIFAYFLLINNFKIEKKYNFLIYPCIIIIITISFGNPKIIRHLIGTINNQNYLLQNVNVKEHEDLNHILNLIEPENDPIAYIQPGRYGDTLSFKQYQKNDTTLIKLSDKIWIPYNPADLFVSLSKKRSLKYISRWIERHPVKRGWFINTRDINIDPWHKGYEEVLFQSLFNYRIIKKIEYGNLKAILFEKNI